MDKDLVIKLIKYAENASPEIWRIAEQQVQVQVWELNAWIFFLGVVTGICLVGAIVSIVAYNNDSNASTTYDILAFCLGIIGLVSAIFTTGSYIALQKMQMNPEYYVIKAMMDFIN